MQTDQNKTWVPIDLASSILKACASNAIENGEYAENIFLHGTFGIGKSSIVHQMKPWLEKKHGKRVEWIDIRLSAMQGHDVQGIPYNAENGEVLEVELSNGDTHKINVKELFFSTPSWWPKNDDDVFYIIFFDEFSNGSKDTQQAAYRVLLDKSIQNGKTLGKNTMIIAAGNLQSDNTGAKAVLPAAANRFDMHLFIDEKRAHKPFLHWGMGEGKLHPMVISYINAYPSALCSKDVKDRVSVARPRTWESVSKILNNRILAEFGEEHVKTAISAAIGNSDAIKFQGFVELKEYMPDWDKVKRTGEIDMTGEMDVQFFLATPLAMNIVDSLMEGDDDAVENLCAAANSVPKEIKAIVVRALKLNPKAISSILSNQHTKKLVKSVTEEM